MKTRLPAFVLATLVVPVLLFVSCGSNQASSSLGNPSRSLSPIESEALSAALNTWSGQLYFRQGNTFSHLYTTVKDIAPPAVIRGLSDGNTITISWEECGTQQGTKGEAQMKNFKSWISSSVLSTEDKKNGITWKGQAEFIYAMRYRATGWHDGLFNPDNISPPADNEPFSPWADVGTEISGNFIGSPTTVSIVKQNGKWTSIVSSTPGISGDWSDNQNIIPVLPTLPYAYDEGYGTQAYLIMQTETYVDGAPETVTDELANAATWAEQQAGSQNWGSGTNTYCELFVENAFGTSGRYTNAYKAFQAIGVSGSPQIPGQIVFFAQNAGNGQLAHTGIYIGNGNFISATSNGVKQYSLTWWSNNVAKYVGYANPPFDWPGR